MTVSSLKLTTGYTNDGKVYGMVLGNLANLGKEGCRIMWEMLDDTHPSLAQKTFDLVCVLNEALSTQRE